jgi:endonuclease/exonuclease/phosphatase (EEP) superfamily protein YafD
MLVLAIIAVSLLTVMTLGTLLTLSNHPHWFIRAYDFPHAQMVIITLVTCCIYGSAARWIFDAGSIHVSWHYAVGGLSLFLLTWLSYGILPYTPFLPVQTKLARTNHADRSICIVVSNVEMENDQHSKWMNTITREDPDLIIALEVDDRWMNAIKPLRELYQYEVAYPQNNWYGLILLSRFPVVQHQIRFRVVEDVPSIDAIIELPSGQEVRFVAVHPRPPEPIRDNHSDQRDAELTLYGHELEHEPRPAIICGDLNDVAWSATSRLFLRLSQMLDPRRGRGFFNSFNAKFWWMRFPLDHVFHSRDFTLQRIERLDDVGSDHFPMLIELQHEPTRKREQQPLEQKHSDKVEAMEIIQRVL